MEECKGSSQQTEFGMKFRQDMVALEQINTVEENKDENESEHQETKIYTNLENGNEMIEIVPQENDSEIYIYKNGSEEEACESQNEFIQVSAPNNMCKESSRSDNKDEVCVNAGDEVEIDKECEDVLNKHTNCEDGKIEKVVEKSEVNVSYITDEKSSDVTNLKNYKTVILEDWEVETPHATENHETNYTNEAIVVSEEPQFVDGQEVITYNNEDCTVIELVETEGNVERSDQNFVEEVEKENENASSAIKPDSVKIPKSITKDEIVKILDESTERVVRPIVPGKDLFFSIELTKRLNQKLSFNKSQKTAESGDKNNESDPSNNNNNTVIDDRQKIVNILEAEEVKDWKSVPTKSQSDAKENGNDMEISNAIKKMEEGNLIEKSPAKSSKKAQLKKFKALDKEWERTVALQQLREEFPTTRKRLRTTKKVNHIPFLASTVVEKALTSPEVTTALKPDPPKRRPCYLPENMSSSKIDPEEKVGFLESNGNLAKISNTVVKTYAVKRKSTDAENEKRETIAMVKKAQTESVKETFGSKPKKKKTVMIDNQNKVLIRRKRKIKLKPEDGNDKRRNLELEKLLGDEGAVRMLYDTQHRGEESSTMAKKGQRKIFKTSKKLKRDLVLKTTLVKNAVMKLSGYGAEGVSLRGKRRLKLKTEELKPEEPLFASTPNVVFYKPKKKQRAEASRILYRHSSSESFDSTEDCRLSSLDADSLNIEGVGDKSEHTSSSQVETPTKSKPKKSELIIRKRIKNLQKVSGSTSRGKAKSLDRPSKLSSKPMTSSKLNLSNVPVRKSSRPRKVSKKYSIWSSTSMDSLSVESLGLKKLKKASTELGKRLSLKELSILQYDHLVQIVLAPVSTPLKNSLNVKVLQELILVFDYLSEEDSCKAVLLSSHGNTFCQGIDIKEIISFKESEKKSEVSQLVSCVREFIKCLAGFKKTLIAGVQAAAVGLGVTILPYCDLVISSDTATFYTPYVKMGQAPEGAPTHTFPRISRQLVSELLFKCNKMTALDALKFGLITQVIPEEKFESDLLMIARNMAAQPVQGIQSIKFLLNRINLDEIEDCLEAEGKLLEDHWNSTECLNNLIKFINSGELQLR